MLTEPVWEFVSTDQPDETYVHRLDERPIRSLANRIIGTQVELANGRQVWALLGNVDLDDARRTRQFLTLSTLVNDAWFHLARYHDVDREDRSPLKLADALGLAIDEVFPIRYDIRAWVLARDAASAHGSIRAEPEERLSRAELIRLAVP